MVGHYERRAEGFGFKRDNIDVFRTHLNRAVGAVSQDPSVLARAVRERVKEASESHERAAGKALRKDANVLCDWVVTLPKDCPPEKADEFFETAVKFAKARYGEENVLGGFLHMDETTPHLHIPIIPSIGGKLQASKMINRQDLKTFHSDLGRTMDAALGVHVSIELDDEDRGRKELSRLSQPEYKAAMAELQRIQRETQESQLRLERLRQREEEAEREISELQSAQESVAESTRYLAEHRGDGARAEQLGERIAECKGELEDCRERIGVAVAERAASEGRAGGLRERIAGCKADLEMVAQRVVAMARALKEITREVFYDVPAAVCKVLGRVGIRAKEGPMPFDEMMREAQEAARIEGERYFGGRDTAPRDYGISR